MPKIVYIEKRFAPASQDVIETANAIIEEYDAQGFDLTVRQLYYQFVARGLLQNTDREYKRLGGIVNDARLAGLIDWDSISDRTRNLRKLTHWLNPRDILGGVAVGYAVDHWEGQKYRPEVWIEKDALLGVISGVCDELDVPYFSCRGYTSQSEMWRAGQRTANVLKHGYTPLIFHFGDHDPSGIDMTRDITDRLALFAGGVEVRRLALNMDQVNEHNPPPNPAKTTDSRYVGYIDAFGDESWELDALQPQVLADLIREEVLTFRDDDVYEAVIERETEERRNLVRVRDRWPEVVEMLEKDA